MRGVCLFSICVLFPLVLCAQQFPFIQLTGPNAPKSSSFLFQDSHGGLWLGGIEGETELRYFDGSRFINPLVERLPQGEIYGIAEDSDGGIWLASSTGLSRVFRGRLQTFLRGSLAGRGITKIGPDIFLTNFATDHHTSHLIRISRSADTWKTEAMMETTSLASFQPDSSGNILYPCADGFCEFRIADALRWQAGVALSVVHHKASPSLEPVATRDRFGCVWMRSEDEVAYQCPGGHESVVLSGRVAGTGYPEISETDDGRMVAPSFGQLTIGRPGRFRVISLANGYPSAASHLIGRDGSIWISNANGLFVFPSRFSMEFWTQREGLDGNTWSILPLGRKVFAFSGEAIEVLNDDRRQWRRIAKVQAGTHLLAGPEGSILASSRIDGIIQMRQDGKVLRRSDRAVVFAMERSGDGQIWSAGERVSRMRFDAKRIILDRASVPGEIHVTTALDTKGDLWTCGGTGFFRESVSEWTSISRDYNLFHDGCAVLTLDGRGNVFFGFRRLWMAASGKDEVLEDSKLISPRKPNFLGRDAAGRLWNGASDGVYVADPEQARQGQWLRLDRSDGLPGNDTNQRSFVTDKDGSVWFGIDSSVVHIFPSNDLVHPSYAPSVFVSGFSWDGGAYQMADLVDSIQNGARVTAYFGSLQMDRRNALNFRYRLLPRQTAWSEGTSADVNLGRLWWGDQKMEVQARIGNGPWSGTASKTFHVLRPVWLSTPALLGFVFAGGMAAMGRRQWKRRRRERDETPLPGLEDWRLAVVSPEMRQSKGLLLDGRFELMQLEARGGFANVWAGQDRQQANRLCAIKIFRHELVDKSWMEKRFQQEVSALTQVDHPNVVRIFAHGVVPSGAPYLVMEFVQGQTLRQVLNERRLTHEETASYLRQAASALAKIHAHGVCHRDVKPENLMIRGEGDAKRELVLIDFSIAIVQDPDETMHGLSRAAGTMHYMAPEQAVGYANESSDIYSLAKILIEMLTGQRVSSLLPDASIDLAERVRELLRELRLGLSEEAIDLIAGALAFDPMRRPRDAAAFGRRIANDLDNLGAEQR